MMCGWERIRAKRIDRQSCKQSSEISVHVPVHLELKNKQLQKLLRNMTTDQDDTPSIIDFNCALMSKNEMFKK